MSKAPDLNHFTKEEIRQELDKIRHPVEVALWGVDNYYNTGCIIRTCHSFLVRKIHLIECSVFYKKASMCTEKYENIQKYDSIKDFFISNKKSIIAVEKNNLLKTNSLRLFEYPADPILLFGSERYGLSFGSLCACDDIITIEQYGLTNSLNVSVCVGIVLNDWMTKNHGRIYAKIQTT